MTSFATDPDALSVPWIDSPFFESLLQSREIDDVRERWARSMRENGYLLLENFVPSACIDRVLERYDWLFAPATEFDAPDWLRDLFRRDANRRQDAFRVLPAVGELAAFPPILEMLQFLYGRAPIPFQTLNFLRGTQQPVHSDAMHFSSLPSGYMCGVWVAFEDVHENNGTLLYHPGSHRLPEIRVDQLGVWGENPQPRLGASYQKYEQYLAARLSTEYPAVERLSAPKGSVLVWAANLAHGGSPIRDPNSTRKSQVTHYYFENSVYYTPIFSNPALGEYFLRDIYDVRTSQRVPHRLNGVELLPEKVSEHRSRLRLPGEGSAPG